MWSRLPGLAVAGLFLVVGWASLDDFGVTWDEPETFASSGRAWITEQLHERGVDPIDHELTGYFFAVDALRGAFAEVMRSRGWLDLVRSYHLFHLLLSTLSIYFLYRIAFELGGRVWVGVVAALALTAMPAFVGHAQNNPKDLPALFFCVVTLFAMVRWLRRGGVQRAIVAGVWLGLACSSRTASLAIPLIAVAWAAWAAPTALRERLPQSAALGGVAIAVFLASWPWLLADPWVRLPEAMLTLSSFSQHAPPVLYLGEVFRGVELPWHYFPVRLLASIPSFGLLCLIANAIPPTPGAGIRGDGRGDLARLAFVWIAVMLGIGVVSPTHYDGVRHFLMIFPALAIAVATGIDALWSRFRGGLAGRVIVFVNLAGAASVAVALIAVHPYQSAYLNEVANAAISDRAEDVFDIEYWGHPLKEGALWLNANAEPDAEVHVPWVGLANFYLTKPGRRLDPRRLVAPGPPRYLMVFTQKSRYDDFLHFVDRECEPIFEVRRQRARLLAIYRGADVRRAMRRTGTGLSAVGDSGRRP